MILDAVLERVPEPKRLNAKSEFITGEEDGKQKTEGTKEMIK